MANSDVALRKLIATISAGDTAEFSQLLAASPDLAKARFELINATRQSARPNFIAQFGRYIYRGDTALHFAATAYAIDMVRSLIKAGANVSARNRLGDEPLHCAASGNPNSGGWNPAAQAATILALIDAGADPNAMNRLGVAPLHKAVRTRCAKAVQALLNRGAHPGQKNRSGSDPMLLARMNTGRGGSGSPESKKQLHEILHLLQDALNASSIK